MDRCATVASLLFTIGKALIELVRSTVAPAYGATDALVILLAWLYYSAQILLLGAEITCVYADKQGSRVEPVSRTASLGQGMSELSSRHSASLVPCSHTTAQAFISGTQDLALD